ncbi:MAG TPA: diaminopimelate epimerase [Chitinispirillaceae bacterium]|nr:diaminopimelate epimerase [Chitinispirillaceae bacterium]
MTTHAIQFQKWQGTGNDFIIPDPQTQDLYSHLKTQAAALCDRRKGIGADGLLFLLPSVIADYKMVIINSDGSEPEMCGNGIRCLTSYIHSKNLSTEKNLTIETGAGIKEVMIVDSGMIKVNMGAPALDAPAIPVAIHSGQVIKEKIIIDSKTMEFTAVSMGNPHAVIYTDNADDDLVKGLGPQIEKHPLFPKKINVEFITVLSNKEIAMRVWERGCGETQACGTGACASVVSGILNKLHDNDVTVHLPGGDLFIQWGGQLTDPVYMTGPAQHVFDGTIRIKYEYF